MTLHRKYHAGRALLRPLLLISVLATSIAASAQQRFASAPVAINALVDAVATSDDHALAQTLGANYKTLIRQDVSQDDIYAFLAAWSQRHTTVVDPSGKTAWLVVGTTPWRMPIPLVKTGSQWHFDTTAGAAEMRRRRLGRNELGAIATLDWLLMAQEAYAKGEGKGQYASRLVSRPGSRDGLYWPETQGVPASPLGPDALAMTRDTPADAAFSGYHFRIMPSTDPASFSIVAWPASYGVSGVYSFLITQDKVISQNSSRAAHKMPATQKQWQPIKK